MLLGPNAYICDECIAICNNIIEDEENNRELLQKKNNYNDEEIVQSFKHLDDIGNYEDFNNIEYQ